MQIKKNSLWENLKRGIIHSNKLQQDTLDRIQQKIHHSLERVKIQKIHALKEEEEQEKRIQDHLRPKTEIKEENKIYSPVLAKILNNKRKVNNLTEVKEKVTKFKKIQENEYKNKIVQLFKKQQKREEALKDMYYRKKYRSANKERKNYNNEDIEETEVI